MNWLLKLLGLDTTPAVLNVNEAVKPKKLGFMESWLDRGDPGCVGDFRPRPPLLTSQGDILDTTCCDTEDPGPC